MEALPPYRPPTRYHHDIKDERSKFGLVLCSASEPVSPLSQISSGAMTLLCCVRPSHPRQRRHLYSLVLMAIALLSLYCLYTPNAIRAPAEAAGLPSFLSPPSSSLAASTTLAAATVEPTCPPFSQQLYDDDPKSCVPLSSTETVSSEATTRLSFIPPKIWQIYLSFEVSAISHSYIVSWLSLSPSTMYTVLDAAGAGELVQRLAKLASDMSLRVPLWEVDLDREERLEYNITKSDGSWKMEQKPHRYEDKTAEEIQTVVAAWNGKLGRNPATGLTPIHSFASDALDMYNAMSRRVLRADFLRYLVLALEGGIYSDIDTTLIRPLRDWVPASMRDRVQLIVGLEADASPPVGGTRYEVQFCQWTLVSAPHHPAMWTMIERILERVRARQQASHLPLLSPAYSDSDVLEITGPAAWTEVVFAHLNHVAGDGVGAERITWETLHNMKEPRLFGDTLVLPIDGFATGVPHSNASPGRSEMTMVKHQFRGNWRENHG